HEVGDAKSGELRTQSAGVEARHIKQGTENLFNGFERSVDIVDQPSILASATLNQSCDVQSRRIQRLQDVMARCRQKFRFRDICGIGFALRELERRVWTSQRPSALGDAPLPRFA